MDKGSSVDSYSSKVYRIGNLKKLVIISHTGHQMHPIYGPVGWGPTIREINFLAKYWDEVVHIACLEKRQPLGSSLPYLRKNIEFVPIETFGGILWWQKLDILYKAPGILKTVHREVKGATEVQLRLPMGIGLVLLLYFKMKSKFPYKLWIKYATSWSQSVESVSYWMQRYLLRINWIGCPVTINGSWPGQPAHCKTFENPCMDQKQFFQGGVLVRSKSVGPPYSLIFIGRMDASKGLDLIMDSILSWPWENISKVHFVGDGPLMVKMEQYLEDLNLPVSFHGFISQENIFSLLEESHFLILPSKSEGFPKVIAEGLNFGCLPIVSTVGSIPQYVKENKTGFLLTELSGVAITEAIVRATTLNFQQHKRMIYEGRCIAQLFTLENYFHSLKKQVFNVF